MRTWIILVLGLSLGFSACSSTGTPNSTELNTVVISNWQAVDGGLFSDDSNGNLKYVAMNSDGTATFYRTVGTTGIITCESFLFGVASDKGLLIDREGSPLQEGLTELYRFEVADSQLTISGSNGSTVTLNKVDSIPTEQQCVTISPTDTFNLKDIVPGYWSNLVYDGTSLWVLGSSGSDFGRFPVNSDTGAVGPVHPYTIFFDYPNQVTCQGADFWNNNAAGDNNPITRIDAADTEIDSFDTSTDISQYIDIQTGAFDGTYLWLFGRNRNTELSYFLKINAEPPASAPVLVQSTEYPSGLIDALAYDGSHFWALVRGPGVQMFLVEIDPATLVAARTFVLPHDDNLRNFGVAAVGNSIFVLGEFNSETEDYTVITKYTP